MDPFALPYSALHCSALPHAALLCLALLRSAPPCPALLCPVPCRSNPHCRTRHCFAAHRFTPPPLPWVKAGALLPSG